MRRAQKNGRRRGNSYGNSARAELKFQRLRMVRGAEKNGNLFGAHSGLRKSDDSENDIVVTGGSL